MYMTHHNARSEAGMTSQERKLDSALRNRPTFDPLFYDEELLLGTILTKDQRYRLFKDLAVSVPIDVLRFDAGGGTSATVIIWRVSSDISESEHVGQIARLVKSLEPNLPEYHTRQMRKEFFSKYG
eukprot:scpid93926/ scgid34867/ 